MRFVRPRLLEYRNTPSESGFSSAEIVFGPLFDPFFQLAIQRSLPVGKMRRWWSAITRLQPTKNLRTITTQASRQLTPLSIDTECRVQNRDSPIPLTPSQIPQWKCLLKELVIPSSDQFETLHSSQESHREKCSETTLDY